MTTNAALYHQATQGIPPVESDEERIKLIQEEAKKVAAMESKLGMPSTVESDLGIPMTASDTQLGVQGSNVASHTAPSISTTASESNLGPKPTATILDELAEQEKMQDMYCNLISKKLQILRDIQKSPKAPPGPGPARAAALVMDDDERREEGENGVP